MDHSLQVISSPLPGIAVLVEYQQQILLGRRSKPPMSDSWQLPGGWLRLAESPEQVVDRLLAEFPGLEYDTPEFAGYSNNIFDTDTHTVSLYFRVRCSACGEDSLRPNTRGKDWCWADWNELPQPLFLPLHLFIQAGFKPFIPD